MRKYFLLSAVALLTATTANATTDYAEVTAKATIEVAGTFECEDIDLGTIVVKQGNKEFVLGNFNETSGELNLGDDIISVSGDFSAMCDSTESGDYYGEYTVELSNANGNKMSLSVEDNDGSLDTTLTIPADVKPGDYTGSFTVTRNL